MRALRRAGWAVHDTSRLGGGFPDLVAGRDGRVVLIEVKDGAKPPSAKRLTPAEFLCARKFAEVGVVVEVLESELDAEAL
jgi:hypothetical protein|tara:strand:+ start:291 stop:530 length:240 start_codon:yes stop_codon:yes gene_type:complete